MSKLFKNVQILDTRGGATEAYLIVRRRRADEGNDVDEHFGTVCK